MVDLDWGTTLDHLTSILSNNVATKLFAGKSVLVLGPQYFPPPAKGKKVLSSFALDGAWIDNVLRQGTSNVGDDKSSDGGRFVPTVTNPRRKHARVHPFPVISPQTSHARAK
jgi:hypothetical protein